MTINMRHSRLWINIEPNVHADSHMFSKEIHSQPHSSYGTLTDESPARGDPPTAIQRPSPLERQGQGEGVWACIRLASGEDRLRFRSEALAAAEAISGRGWN